MERNRKQKLLMIIALIAGNGFFGYSSSNYLYSNDIYWTMSPGIYSSNFDGFAIQNGGRLNTLYLYYPTGGVRPVISLKSNVRYNDGDGSFTNPYKIVTDNL